MKYIWLSFSGILMLHVSSLRASGTPSSKPKDSPHRLTWVMCYEHESVYHVERFLAFHPSIIFVDGQAYMLMDLPIMRLGQNDPVFPRSFKGLIGIYHQVIRGFVLRYDSVDYLVGFGVVSFDIELLRVAWKVKFFLG